MTSPTVTETSITPQGCRDLRTPDVAAVLDAVRATGLSAFPAVGAEDRVSSVVVLVALERNLNPVALQRAVLAYADAL
jgi:hypothetical protein